MTIFPYGFILTLMRIDSLSSDIQILKEVGERLKTARLRAKMTQAELSSASGVGKSTIERAEQGEGIQLLNLIKIMRSLDALPQLDTVFPLYELSPMDYLAISDKKSAFAQVKRVYKKRKGSSSSDSDFVWGEDK